MAADERRLGHPTHIVTFCHPDDADRKRSSRDTATGNGKRGTVADEHLSPGPKDVGSLHKLVSFSQPELFEAETKLDVATGVLGLTAFVVSRKSCQ